MERLKNPITVNINDWLMDNRDLVAAAKRIPNDGTKVTLFATEHGDAASHEMFDYARENGAMILVSVSEKDLAAIA